MKKFDYYIFIDYSENLIGYIILDKEGFENILPKVSKLKHYTTLRYKKQYLASMKKLFIRNEILGFLKKYRIAELRQNVELCSEIFEFCERRHDSKIFISIDDRQYNGFMRLAKILNEKRFTILREGKLKKGSKEYQASLVLDTLLNLKRNKE